MGRAPRTKETLPDFHEWCRATRHPLLFLQVDGLSTDPRDWGVTRTLIYIIKLIKPKKNMGIKWVFKILISMICGLM